MMLEKINIDKYGFKQIQKIDQNEEPQFIENLQSNTLIEEGNTPTSSIKVKKINLVILLFIGIVIFSLQFLIYPLGSSQKSNKIQQISKITLIENQTSSDISSSEQEKQRRQINLEKNLKLQETKQKQQMQSLNNNIQPSGQLLSKNEDYAQDYITPELSKALKQGRYFDIHYFIQDQHTKKPPRIVHKAESRIKKKQTNIERPLLKIQKSSEEIESIIYKMKNPPTRPKKLPNWKFLQTQNPNLTDLTFFAYELNKQPDNNQFLQAQYYHYNKLYNIGQYSKQLPLCIAMVGKNNANVIFKMYQSIKRQNYTNYIIVQIDDNSDDDTLQKTLKYLSENPFISERTTVVTTNYQRNALYNRHFANTQYCQEGDIIIDLDSDDWLIGKQVFQLVNSLYQAGNLYKGNKEQLWSLFLNNIAYADSCCPYSMIFGQLSQRVVDEKIYRNSDGWRTTHLRTYLRKLYQKIDSNDYIDPINIRKGQYYGQAPDLFMMDAIWELSAPKHVRFIDQYVYFYTGSRQRDNTYPQYCSVAGRSLPPYEPLQNLEDTPTRRKSLGRPEILQKQKKKALAKFQSLKIKILEIYKKNKKNLNP